MKEMDRLKLFMQNLIISRKVENQKDFGARLGYDNESSFSQLLKKDKITDRFLTKVKEVYPILNIDWLINGTGEMLIDPLNKLEKVDVLEENYDLEGLDKKYIVPLLPISAMGGTLIGFADSLDPHQTFQKLVSPIKGADWALTVTGESMSPEYPNGSVVLIKKINERAFIDWGKTFVLDTCNGVIIKRLMPSEDKGAVRCESINIDYPPFDIHFEDIYGVYRVLMCLSSK